LFDLKGEDSFIRGGGPTFYFLEARKEARWSEIRGDLKSPLIIF
jgi:hypothetical protein